MVKVYQVLLAGGGGLSFFEDLSVIINTFGKNFGYNQHLQKKLLGALSYNSQFRLACPNFSENLAPAPVLTPVKRFRVIVK